MHGGYMAWVRETGHAYGRAYGHAGSPFSRAGIMPGYCLFGDCRDVDAATRRVPRVEASRLRVTAGKGKRVDAVHAGSAADSAGGGGGDCGRG